MPILQRPRPLDSSLMQLNDGLVVEGGSSSATVYGMTPESAMVNEIFNNPDAWDTRFDEEGDVDYAGPLADLKELLYGLVSGNSVLSEGSTLDGTSNDYISHASLEEYYPKRRPDIRLKTFTLKSFESRRSIMPSLSSASSIVDTSSLASSSLTSSTLSLDSSHPVIYDDEVSVDLHSHDGESLELGQTKWQGVKEVVDDHDNLLPLLALVDPSVKNTPEEGKTTSIHWSHALPSPKGDDDGQSSSSGKSATKMLTAMTSAFSRLKQGEISPQTDVGHQVRLLTISTDTTTRTRTARSMTITQSPDISSPSSVTVVGASATWNILELYGNDSPKRSPVVGPKTLNHFSFKPLEIARPPEQSSASTSTSQQQLRVKPKLKGPRLAPKVPRANAANPPLTLLEEKDLPRLINHDGKIRPLPKLPAGDLSTAIPSPPSESTPDWEDPTSMPRPRPSSVTSTPPPPAKFLVRSSSEPLPPLGPRAIQTPKPLHPALSPFSKGHLKADSESTMISGQPPKGELLPLRSRFLLPPPTPPLDLPLPPVPEPAVDTTSQNPLPYQDVSLNPQKRAVSPLPSSILRKLHTLESPPSGDNSVLRPPTSFKHKPSASDSSVMFSGNGRDGDGDALSSYPPPAPKTSIGKHFPMRSISQFAPDVPLPDAATLAKRVRKNATPQVQPHLGLAVL